MTDPMTAERLAEIRARDARDAYPTGRVDGVDSAADVRSLLAEVDRLSSALDRTTLLAREMAEEMERLREGAERVKAERDAVVAWLDADSVPRELRGHALDFPARVWCWAMGLKRERDEAREELASLRSRLAAAERERDEALAKVEALSGLRTGGESIEKEAREFAASTAYPKGARLLMRKVLTMLDASRATCEGFRAAASASASLLASRDKAAAVVEVAEQMSEGCISPDGPDAGRPSHCSYCRFRSALDAYRAGEASEEAPRVGDVYEVAGHEYRYVGRVHHLERIDESHGDVYRPDIPSGWRLVRRGPAR